METGRVDRQVGLPVGSRFFEIQPAGQAGWKTGQILLFWNQKTSKHQPKHTYIFYHK